jgi:hypothetical protein
MSKLLSTIAGAALALSLSGFALAADQSTGQSSQGTQGAQSSQSGGQSSGQSSGQSGQATGQSDAYKAAMQKCQQMSGADKQKCMDTAKKKHGQM